MFGWKQRYQTVRPSLEDMHDRALQAEQERDEAEHQVVQLRRERDVARAVREQYRIGRDKAWADNEALRDQLQAVTAERDTALAEQERNFVMGERDSLWQDMETIHEITSKHMGDNDDA